MITTKELNLLANWELVRETDKNVAGMKGLADHFIKGLPAKDRRLVKRWEEIRIGVIDDFLAKAEADGWGKSSDSKKP
jgi:hypothetical protein